MATAGGKERDSNRSPARCTATGLTKLVDQRELVCNEGTTGKGVAYASAADCRDARCRHGKTQNDLERNAALRTCAPSSRDARTELSRRLIELIERIQRLAAEHVEPRCTSLIAIDPFAMLHPTRSEARAAAVRLAGISTK